MESLRIRARVHFDEPDHPHSRSVPLAVAQDKPAPSTGYRPTGSPVDLHELGRLARLRDPRAHVVGFSSYDRKGGNDDGFNGTYSKIRVENGDSVLAELDGPGVIQRIWTTHTSGEKPGLLNRKHEHIRIYLDGKAEPALDVPMEDLFSGQASALSEAPDAGGFGRLRLVRADPVPERLQGRRRRAKPCGSSRSASWLCPMPRA